MERQRALGRTHRRKSHLSQGSVSMSFDRLESDSLSGRRRSWASMYVAVALAVGACSNGVAQQESQVPDLSAATQKAQQALDSPVDLELNAPTLEAALGRIAATTGTAIRIDFGALMS